MSRLNWLRLFVIPFLAVFMTSLIFTTPVRADDATPPPVDPPASSGPADASSVPADKTAKADSERRDTNGSSAQTLSQVPAGTDVVVVDGSGASVPLATQEAAKIVATGDPIWCPSTVAVPVTGASGCTTPGASNVNYDPTRLDSLISYLASHQRASNGTIWITGGNDQSIVPITLDGSTTFTTMAKYSLMLKGGWTGIGNTINTSIPSTFNQSISITSWKNNITLSDIQISGVIGDGLTVSTKKNITLTRVQSNGNTLGRGAKLDNSSGTGTVTITSSLFNTNHLDGLDITSKGAITLNTVTASSNTSNGATLDNCQLTGSICSGSGGVTITSSTFNTNGTDGLDITSKGAITLNTVTANWNTAGLGANLDNSSGTGAVKITASQFNTNGQDGLDVFSRGAITVNSLTTDASTAASGTSLINTLATSAQPVTLAGILNFNDNFAYGLSVESNGLITVNSVTATGNGNVAPGPIGVSLDNAMTHFNSGIIFTGTNIIDGNFYDGLMVFSNGPIKMNNIKADNNTSGAGAVISNNSASGPQPVTLTGTNQFNGNGLGGLIVYSNGAITTYNLTADTNSGGTPEDPLHPIPNEGVYLDNCNSDGSVCTNLFARPVNVLGSNEFDGNFNDGLNIQSRGGVITVNNIVADGNGTTSHNGVGAVLENDYSNLQSAVKITGTNEFNGNYDFGLLVESNGAIVANHVTADSTVNTAANHGYGALLDNCIFVTSSCTATGAQPITLIGINKFNGNASHGLVIESRGTITLNNITADNNGITATNHGVGAYLQNNFSNSAAGVTLAGANEFTENYGTYISSVYGGLAVFSNGVIRANNLTAESNTNGDGVYLNNSYAGVSRSVTLTGINTFNTNGYNGLHIESFGNIIASDLNANGNGVYDPSGSGALLKNNFINSSSILSTGSVRLTGTNIFTGNNNYGLEVPSNGAIRISNLTADSSVANYGAYLNNTSSPTAQPVVLTGNDTFNDNYYGGLVVYSHGSISLNTASLTAIGNGIGGSSGDGVYLANYSALTPKPITVKGMSMFDGNYESGIRMYSMGAITASNLTSSNNQTGWGVVMYNDFSGAVGNVKLTGNNNFYGNSHDGLTVTSRGAITVSNIVANTNGQSHGSDIYGIWLNNTNAVNKAVTVSGTNVFNGNWSGGMYVSTTGAITVNNVTAVGNTGNGLNIQTNGTVTLNNIIADGNSGDGLHASTPLTLKLTCGSFIKNVGYGINLYTNGTATIKGAVLSGNTSGDTIYHTGSGPEVIVRTCTLP